MKAFFSTLYLVLFCRGLGPLKSRRALVMALLALLPVGGAFMTRFMADQGRLLPALEGISWYLLVGVVTPLVSLITGAAVVAEEVADGTIVFVITRPVSRAGFFLGRYLSALLSACILLLPAAYLMFHLLTPAQRAQAGLPLLEMGRLSLLTVLLGLLVYTALFAALASFFKRPMLLGVGYVMVFEFFLANLPGPLSGFSIQHLLRSFLAGSGQALWSRQANEVVAALVPASLALHQILATTGSSLLLGMLFISRRQFASRANT